MTEKQTKMSTIPAAAHQAAQHALNAVIDADDAREDSPAGSGGDDDEAGQVLETDAAPATDVDRTVFDDPKSFNVKVALLVFLWCSTWSYRSRSTPSTHHGPCGSTPPKRRTSPEACPRHPLLPSPLRPPVAMLRRGGWTISKRSSPSTAWKNSGGALPLV